MINLSIPQGDISLQPRITVVGVGGAGGNAVNNMIRAELQGVEFLVANTDAQALVGNQSSKKLQLGVNLTQGLGAGSRPDIGKAAAEEQIDQIAGYLEGSHMVFITAGMGGGTGTGAAPVIARAARELGVLTVGVVTKPFHFEGAHRMRIAEQGLSELQQFVDTLIIIPNQNLFRIANERTTFADAFRLADEVLHSGVRGVTDLMVQPGLINLDFADIRTVMAEMGKAMMGTGEGEGERRAILAAEAAISNPLLDDVSMKGAKGVLINITGGLDMTLYEVDEATNRIRDEVDPDANIIFGSTFNPDMEGTVRVSVVATGIDAALEAAAGPGAHAGPQSVYTGSGAAGRGGAMPPRTPPLVTVTNASLSPPRPAAPAVPAAQEGETSRSDTAEGGSRPGTTEAAAPAPDPARPAFRPGPPPAAARPSLPHAPSVPARPEGRALPSVPPRSIVAPTAQRPAMPAAASQARMVPTPAEAPQAQAPGHAAGHGSSHAAPPAPNPAAQHHLQHAAAAFGAAAAGHAPAPVAASPAPQPVVQPAAESAPDGRRSGRIGLFQRITGMLGGEEEHGGRDAPAPRAESPRMAPVPSHAPAGQGHGAPVAPRPVIARGEAGAGRQDAGRPAEHGHGPTHGQHQPSQPRPVSQPTLAIDGGRASSRSDDDALDIPAFLRRQAN